MERLHLKKLEDVEGEEQYFVEASNKFTGLEDLEVEADISTAWEKCCRKYQIFGKRE
jgi:hypothetical protein